MLILCPECELQVSDKAITCPHCGYPLKVSDAKAVRRTTCTSTRHRRLPNGFGQITKISKKNLRNPYRVMVPAGKTEEGRPISKLLKPKAYFKTYNDAYEALIEYNKNPFDVTRELTVEDVYKQWRAEFIKKPKAATTIKNYDSPWNYCKAVYDLPIRQLKVQHIKQCAMAEDVPVTVKQTIKSMFNVLLDYAFENEYVDKNCARMFKLSEEVGIKAKSQRKSHSSFTDEEMHLLWQNKQDEDVQTVLIQCYTGLRPQELCSIYLENIDFEQNIIKCGMKTEAGTNRTVPIHPAILPFVKGKYEISVKWGIDRLITAYFHQNKSKRVAVPYTTYSHRFSTALARSNINAEHRPHDPRKQFVTMAKRYNMDEYAIKRIAGHKINDVTEAIYTDRSVEWLYQEISKLPVY